MADIGELASTQRWLASLISDPDAFDRDEEGSRRLTITDDALRKERLLAYVNGYPARIFDALSEAYPALKHVVGDHAFADLTNRYRFHIPSGIYSLTDAGEQVPRFLRGDSLGRDFEFAADLARLEWCIQRAFHSRERDPFDAATSSEWTMEDWETARIEFQPAVAVVTSDWPIHDIWSARETPIEQIDIDLVDKPQAVLVSRSGFRVRCEVVPAEEAAIFDLLASGISLGETMQRVAETHAAPDIVLSLFQRAALNGLLVACHKAAG